MADYCTFITVFPEFLIANVPEPQFDYWNKQAPLQLNPAMFGANFDLASMLFIAHNITLGLQEKADAERGKTPGDALGPISSKSVGGISISYDASDISVQGAGVWNATSYGQRLYKMMQGAACGGVYRAPARSPASRTIF